MEEVVLFHVRLSSGEQFGPAPLETIIQWANEGRVPVDALLVPADGAPVRSIWSELRLRPILQMKWLAPPTAPMEGLTSTPPADTGMSAMIPYRNPPALIGYYTAVASLIPMLGTIAGPVAIGFGIAGIRKRNAQPEAKGLAHAWIAIIGGIIGFLISAGCIASAIIAANTP